MSVLKGLRLERAQGSKQFADGVFRNTSGAVPGLKGNPLPIVGEFFFGGRARRPRAPPPVENPLAAWAGAVLSAGLGHTWPGQRNDLAQIRGPPWLTDPVFGQRAS